MAERVDFSAFPYHNFFDIPRFTRAAEQRLSMYPVASQKRQGEGYGFSYNSEHAKVLLETPVTEPDFLSTQGREYYSGLNKKRVKVGSFGEKLSDIDGWYMQGLEPTCVPMAVATIARYLKKTLSPDVFATFLNLANGINSQDSGLSGVLTESIINDFANNLSAQRIVRKWSLAGYAKVVTNTINDKMGVLETVDGDAFYGEKPDDELHQIAIIGYREQQGYLDLEVVDSNLGRNLMPVEFLHRVRRAGLMLVW